MDRAKLLTQIKSIIATRGPTQPTIVTASQVLELMEQELQAQPFVASSFITNIQKTTSKDNLQLRMSYKIGEVTGMSEKLRMQGFEVQEASGIIVATINKGDKT